MLETITQPMTNPEHRNNTQHRLDIEAYHAYKCKDRVAPIFMLSNMRNELMLRFEKHRSSIIVWEAMKIQYGGTATMSSDR